ncbi:MAG: amino acid racemase [Cytophagales bacterium]|nr:amino acid racemase [Cytophagales bacterium]
MNMLNDTDDRDQSAEEQVIGIVGGMGPQAGIELANDIFRLTEAKKDQEHRSVIMMSYPGQLGDRTAYIEGTELINPAFNIAKVIQKLELSGADVVGIACNSSHVPAIYNVILDELKKSSSRVRLLNMPKETCKHIKEHFPEAAKVGVMSTNGTYKAGVYVTLLEQAGLQAVVPTYSFQNEVIHDMVYNPSYGIKSCPEGITDEVIDLLGRAFSFFQEQGVDAVILGCTEIPLALKQYPKTKQIPLLINPSEILAKALIAATERRQLAHGE